MEIIHIMSKHPETVEPGDTLAKASQMMEVGGFRRLAVVKDGAVVGMLTERDVRQHRGHLDATRVNAAMSEPVLSVTPHTTVQEAVRMMLKRKVGGMPVIDKGNLVGMVTTTDMLEALLQIVEDYEASHPKH
ncbi:MAG TPA: CBS domain-containing protein [Candidatus Binataceae bacterium]|nr:CBS domain-containing protein [Candidatus Binataceae bacterium]